MPNATFNGLVDTAGNPLRSNNSRNAKSKFESIVKETNAAVSANIGRGGYRDGQHDEASWEFDPLGIGENSAIKESRDLSMRRQRDRYRNCSLTKRAVHCLRDLIVGEGLHCLNDPIHFTLRELMDWRKLSPDARMERIIGRIDYGLASDEAFEEWANDPKQCDREGRRTWFQMQRTAISEVIQVGDCLIAHELVKRPQGQSPLVCQMYEKEQIDVSKDTVNHKSKDYRIENGFVLDEFGREIGVMLYRDHPQESLTMNRHGHESTMLPIAKYQHLFQPIRPRQSSGFTWLHAIGQPARDRDMFLESEIRYAVKAAMHIIAVHLDNPDNVDLGFSVGSDDAAPRSVQDLPTLSNSPVAHVLDAAKSEKVELLESNRPNSNANDFFDLLEHSIANGVDLSYHTMTGRYSKTTYEGIRGALQAENVQIKPLQKAFGMQCCLNIRQMFNDLAVLNRQIDLVTVSQYFKNKKELNRYDVVGPGRVLLNMEKETDGQMAMLRAGFTTYKETLMSYGRHWLKTLRQKFVEKELFNVMGIVLDWSKGNGGNVMSGNPSADADQNQQVENENAGVTDE